MVKLNLESAVAHYLLGDIRPEDLPAVAQRAVIAGFESPAMAELAYSLNKENEFLERKFFNALEELKIKKPSRVEAGLAIAREIATSIVEERITPYEGARRIWWDVYVKIPQLKQLIPFVGMASEFEDDSNHRDNYSQMILQEARKLMAEV